MGPEEHGSPQRSERNKEALDYYRERSRAPGVASGGAERNHYCMACNGVIPLEYDSRRPAAGSPQKCPHCGAELDPRVRAMFNWVEIDQVPAGDARFVLIAAGLVLALAAAAAAVWWLV